tara:strand:+ start:8751 stop:9683 length:933 start_codon:yes stop_codon:yes gene_type:complete
MNRILALLVSVFLPVIFNAQKIVSEALDLKNGAIGLPGTLTYPKSVDNVPLAIFVHGSGNIDRNGNQVGLGVQANYIKTLGDSLNAHGIAFYRFDKRTATPSNLDKLQNVTIEDFAEDVKVAIAHFAHDNRFSSISLIGHSQGALVAMLAITNDVGRYISIAGAGETIDKTVIGQINKQSADLAAIAQNHFNELEQTDTIVNVNLMLLQLFAPQNQKFFKHWMMIDPTVEIKKLKVPILILNGDSDLQVQVTDAELLKEARPDANLYIIPRMNHVLKEVHSITENKKSYTEENIPLSSLLVAHLTDFIKI